ncbi:coiled-coil domain-containing protein 107 isoform X2 [Sorex araneus]|uniref:coiled-coil domain-containing protein 107 isoform X2 n=1 Tax=Sorex araneus TaxID=42254 RepID=UPI002433A6F3|nr:coiled-coil domain-containing protein 107 isoform X2 [Sorex araneus]
MESGRAFAGVLGLQLLLLLVSPLPQVLADSASSERRGHAGDAAQLGPGSSGSRRPPLQEQRERARAGALPWGALYTAAVVAFVLYKCLQGKDEAALLQEEASRKKSFQSDQELVQLTQQLAQTEQHLNNLMAQLDPLFDRVTTLAGAQKELLDLKLQTIHRLLGESKPSQGAEVTGTEPSPPFPGDLEVDEAEETGDCHAWEEPLNWSPEMRNLTAPCHTEQGLRRRCSQAAVRGPSRSPCGEGGVRAEGLVKQSLFS